MLLCAWNNYNNNYLYYTRQNIYTMQETWLLKLKRKRKRKLLSSNKWESMTSEKTQTKICLLNWHRLLSQTLCPTLCCPLHIGNLDLFIRHLNAICIPGSQHQGHQWNLRRYKVSTIREIINLRTARFLTINARNTMRNTQSAISRRFSLSKTIWLQESVINLCSLGICLHLPHRI